MTSDEVENYLFSLVDEGLLHLGWAADGSGFVFWPTEDGLKQLGLNRHAVSAEEREIPGSG